MDKTSEKSCVLGSDVPDFSLRVQPACDIFNFSASPLIPYIVDKDNFSSRTSGHIPDSSTCQITLLWRNIFLNPLILLWLFTIFHIKTLLAARQSRWGQLGENGKIPNKPSAYNIIILSFFFLLLLLFAR